MELNSIALAMSSASASQQGAGNTGLMMGIFLVFMVGYMFVIFRKDKKQQQAEQDMRENLKIGDEIITIGGIMGRVVTIKDDSVVIETGADRNKIRFTKQAIGRNVTEEKKAEELKKAKLESAKKAAAEKKKK